MKDAIKLILEDTDRIPTNFHELKNMLEQLENPNEKMHINNIYKFKNPMLKIPNISEDITKQIVLIHTITNYSKFVGIVVKVRENKYAIRGTQIINSRYDPDMTTWVTTGHSILETISKFRIAMGDNYVMFYVIRNKEEMLCVLNEICFSSQKLYRV